MNGDWEPFKAVYILTFHFNVKFIPYICTLLRVYWHLYVFFSRNIAEGLKWLKQELKYN